MAETDVQKSLETIQQKLKLLLDKHAALLKDFRRLETEKNQLQLQLEVKEKQNADLKQQNDVLKSGIRGWHPEQKKLFVKRIDLYLKEIEKCIALVNE